MRTVIPVLLATVALLAAACGVDSGADSTTSTSISAPSTTSTAAVGSTTTTSTLPATTTTVEATTTTSRAPGTTTTTGLPGEPIDFGPAEGDVLMVIGVRHDDVLNLRAGPGTSQAIRDEIPPTFDDLVARGNTRQLPSSLWVEVSYENTTGWVSLKFVGYEGDTTDETARIVSELGETPVEATMTALGELVAEQFASQDEPESDIVQVTAVTTGDLAEVTYDVVGLGDDAVRGVRLHIFAEQSSGGFSLKSVEVTLICGRGVDGDGACV
jgi:hypothetical protein